MQDFIEISDSFYFLYGSAAGFMVLLAFTALALVEVDLGPPGGLKSQLDCVYRLALSACSA